MRWLCFAITLILLASAMLLPSCRGGGGFDYTGQYWPPVEPRHPERLVLAAPDVADPYEWWRLNIFSAIPAGVYSTQSQSERAEQFVTATNEVRAKYGLSQVEAMPQLNRVAQAHARDQAIRDYWWHETPEGLWSRDRIAAAGGGVVSVGGENQAIGEPGCFTPEAVVAQWEQSPGHRTLLLNPDVKYIGIGIYNYGPKAFEYYTQLLVDFE